MAVCRPPCSRRPPGAAVALALVLRSVSVGCCGVLGIAHRRPAVLPGTALLPLARGSGLLPSGLLFMLATRPVASGLGVLRWTPRPGLQGGPVEVTDQSVGKDGLRGICCGCSPAVARYSVCCARTSAALSACRNPALDTCICPKKLRELYFFLAVRLCESRLLAQALSARQQLFVCEVRQPVERFERLGMPMS